MGMQELKSKQVGQGRSRTTKKEEYLSLLYLVDNQRNIYPNLSPETGLKWIQNGGCSVFGAKQQQTEYIR